MRFIGWCVAITIMCLFIGYMLPNSVFPLDKEEAEKFIQQNSIEINAPEPAISIEAPPNNDLKNYYPPQNE